MIQFWQRQQVATITAGSTGNEMQHSCGCVGPQRGEPYCPCRMRGVIERDGHWIVPEQNLGPIRRTPEPNNSINYQRPTPTDTGGR